MKLSLTRALALTAVGGLLLTGATACNRGGDSAGASNPKVVMALSTLNNPFFVEVRDGAQAAAKAANIQLEVVDAQRTVLDARNAWDDGKARYRVALSTLQTLTGAF